MLGTALTVDQLKLARRFAEDIVICFDGDEAGRRAALRAFPLCVDAIDLWPRAVFLPSGDDPDSFVRRVGASGFAERITAAPTLFDFYLDELVGRDAGVGETARAATRMAGLLGNVQDPIVRDKIVRGVAGRLGVSDAALLEAAQRSRVAETARNAAIAGARRPGEPPRVPAPSGAREERGPGGRASAATRGRAHFSFEAELVELILCDAEVAARAAEEGVCSDFGDPEMKRLAEMILARRAARRTVRGERAAGRAAARHGRARARGGSPWRARRRCVAPRTSGSRATPTARRAPIARC